MTTSCKVFGHTTEAARDARKKLYALSDRFGPHSIFFTVTPDDECSYRVRMYANQGKEITLPSPDCSDSECIQDFELRYRKRMQYPGACSLDYQAAIQAVCELLGWDLKKNCGKGIGMYGRCKAFVRGDEEQGRFTLHGHCLVWIDGFDDIRELFFDEDVMKRQAARDEMCTYVDKCFCSDYEYNSNLQVIHEACGACRTIQEMFEEADPQTLRGST